MLNKKILIPIALLTTAIFAIGYGIATKYEPLTSLFNSNIYDTTETDMPPNFDGDASQMFNERGFYKSNSTSFDENEIISDFNGNLMYEIPLYKFKGNGDVNLDLNLVYNGSVNHQIIMATENYFVNNSNSTRYNISSPEWMISLNGICIQTLNFESFMLTDPTLSGDINGNRIKKLIPGYHYDDRLRSAGNGDKDRIYILMGDGSSLTLVNKNTSETGGDAYTGTYYADSKESHIKAFVYYDETDSGPYDYKNRYVELMMGDGLIYKFREYKRNFNDISTSEGITASRPQILLLQQIFDMYGHSINVTYGWNSLKQFGRPLLQSVGITNQTIDFEYGMYWGMCLGFYMRNYAIGNYKFRFNEAISFDGEGNKTASLQDIVNPVSQTARILYDNNYLRSLLNLTCQGWQTSKNIRFGNMNRISSFTNFMGGTRKYKYFGTNQADINFAALINGVIKSSGTDFQGNGRDAFFVNMIDTLGVYDKNQVQKSKQSFSYYYADNGTTYTSQEIDSSDIYSTTRQIISRDANTVNNSENSTSIKEYRYYPVKEYGTRNIEEIDISAVNKIIKDSVFNTNGSYQSSDFIYETGAYNSPVFNGSFLLLTKADTVNGKSRFTNYIYKYFEPNGTHNKYDSLVIEKVEIDPLGYKTSVEFMNFDETVDFYRGWAMLGAYNYRNTTPPPDTISVLGQKLFYKSGLPLVTKRYNNTIDRFTYPLISDLLLKQQTNEYITSENNSLGYIGELISTKDYAQGSTNTYIETKYEYYKKDTTGRALYSDYKFPYVEGNLKKTIFPENKEEKYFYYLVTKTDTAGDYDEPQGSAPSPKVYYKIKYNTGNELLTWNNFQDTRLPVKIDNYKVNSSSRDTLKVVYMSYNALGNPTMMVNQSGYLTTFDYDNTYNRIYKITLPGDYSTNLDRDTMYAVPSYYYSPVSVYTEGWGALDNEELDHTYNSTCASSFNLKYNVDNTSAFKIKPFMKFTQINLSSYTGIDSAIITLSPQWYTARNSSGVNIETDYEWRFKAVTQVGDSSITSCEVVSQDPVLSTYSILAPFSTSLYRNYNDQGRNCESYVTHNLRIESLLNNLRTNSQKFYGLLVDYKYTGIEEEDAPPNYQFRMIFTDCNNFNYGEWADLYKPKLTVYGQRVEYDTVRTKIYYGGTYIYEYDDLNRTTTIKSRFNHSSSLTNFKKVKYNFDGFGNIKEKDVYTSSSAFDDYNFAFNFMNQPAENIDARNNSTKLSYDYLGRQKKTLNADNSFSTTGYEYVNTVSEYFSGTYSGLVEKQTYTDETNRSFTKYFDAVGNLLREEKTVAASSGNSQIPAYEDQPYDPDTTYEGQDAPANWLALRTDYKYDELYRLTDVKTPGGKLIKYYYDAYGRQSQRNTPDAGTTRYSYDNNGNLILSQDANQYNISTILNSRRTYDGLNRLVSISDYKVSGSGGTGPMGDTLLPFEFDTPPGIDSIYIINVYDTLTTAVADIFNSIKPSDYNTAPNYTRGNLVATAYRTVLGEDWGYKFYRYDERGNFTKMWHYIVGLGWKAEMYYHNSQSQLTRNWYQPNQGDGKLFTYGYDDAGRLDYVNQYMGSQPGDPENEGDYPSSYFTLTKYTYDENSQVDLHKLNDNTLTTNYNYNNRNWIFTTSQTGVSSAIFRYTMLYNANGNIRKQISLGTYRSNFSDNSDLWETYIYDNSNRLLKADRDSGVAGSTHDLINGYDKDGNFQGMKRYGSANNLADDFSYSYYSGTNKLQRVTGTKTQYTYDDNGNMTKDDINRTSSIKYDHRNLMTEIRVIKTETPSIFEPPVDVLYLTQYKYDEAGNRVRKTRYKYTGSTPDPVFDLTGDAPPWILQSDEFYVRDVT
ncbi:MAG: RHS repeat protein, partial [Ignavibacteria bacterium]|nr:RHS repeat protein [Ignavibacteria bacterium]